MARVFCFRLTSSSKKRPSHLFINLSICRYLQRTVRAGSLGHRFHPVLHWSGASIDPLLHSLAGPDIPPGYRDPADRADDGRYIPAFFESLVKENFASPRCNGTPFGKFLSKLNRPVSGRKKFQGTSKILVMMLAPGQDRACFAFKPRCLLDPGCRTASGSAIDGGRAARLRYAGGV